MGYRIKTNSVIRASQFLCGTLALIWVGRHIGEEPWSRIYFVWGLGGFFVFNAIYYDKIPLMIADAWNAICSFFVEKTDDR